MDMIPAVLSHRFKGRVWTYYSDTQEIVYMDGQPGPTLEEIEALWPEVQVELADELLHEQRVGRGQDILNRLTLIMSKQNTAFQLSLGPIVAEVVSFLECGGIDAALSIINAQDLGVDGQALKESLLGAFDDG